MLPPEVSLDVEERLNVKVRHALLGEDIELSCDWVVLSTPLVQHEAGIKLAKILKVPLGPNEFFLEAHVKLRPIDFATDGIYLCGTAHAPKDIAESVSQAYAAASRAAIPMEKRKVNAEAITAVINEDLCIGCELCVEYCPYGAIDVVDRTSKVIDVTCKGCGVCAAACPNCAITMRHFTDQQVLAQIRTAF
jgi:heterodisulfide reductase subunit A